MAEKKLSRYFQLKLVEKVSAFNSYLIERAREDHGAVAAATNTAKL